MAKNIAVIYLLLRFIASAVLLTSALAGEARSDAHARSNPALECDANNSVTFAKGNNISSAPVNPERRRSIELMQETNRRASEIVRRELGSQGIVYYLDTSRSLDCIEAELEAKIGGLLKFAVSHHKRNIKNIIAAHRSVRGWPGAYLIRLTENADYNICIVSPFSHEKTAVDFASRMMGDRNLPVVHEVNEYAVRLLAALHEGYHCVVDQSADIGLREKTQLEIAADISAANEAIKSDIAPADIAAFADWRAIKFASGIADVIAGRVDAGDTYSIVSPSYMSTVGIMKLLGGGPVLDYEQVLKLRRDSTPAGLYGSKSRAQRLMTDILQLSKNTEAVERYPNTTLYDADEILSLIGAPREIVEAVRSSISRYVLKLDCRQAQLALQERRMVALVCRQSDDSFVFAAPAVLGLERLTDEERSIDLNNASATAKLNAEFARTAFQKGQRISFPSHARYHQLQSERRRQ